MGIIADLQIHSSHSRATSKNITFQNLEKFARMKGLNLLGTGDFQHPKQFESINDELKEDENGILWSKTKFPFLWQTEISLIYTDKDRGKGQRIHNLIFSPNKDVAKQIIDALSKKGRVATIFDFKDLSYKNFLKAIRTGDGLKSTIETPTFYGKYHFSGHRNCGIVVSPKESLRLNQICPNCGNKLIIGVADRIEKLADRSEGFKRENIRPFVSLVPLSELISVVYNRPLASKNVWLIYNKLIEKFGNEFNILLNVEENELLEVVDKKLVDVILLNREGKLKIIPGSDGVYGQIILDEKETIARKKSLAEF